LRAAQVPIKPPAAQDVSLRFATVLGPDLHSDVSRSGPPSATPASIDSLIAGRR
jgi:hypothetical protein